MNIVKTGTPYIMHVQRLLATAQILIPDTCNKCEISFSHRNVLLEIKVMLEKGRHLASSLLNIRQF